MREANADNYHKDNDLEKEIGASLAAFLKSRMRSTRHAARSQEMPVTSPSYKRLSWKQRNQKTFKITKHTLLLMIFESRELSSR